MRYMVSQVKPDGVQRALLADIIKRFESKVNITIHLSSKAWSFIESARRIENCML